MTIFINGIDSFTLDHAATIWRSPEAVVLTETTCTKIAQGRQAFEHLLYGDQGQFIYGTTSAPGARAKHRLSAEEQQAQGTTLADFIHVVPTFGGRLLSEETKRLILFARLANFVEGTGKVRVETAQCIADLIASPLPSVGLGGSTGPGEVMLLRRLLQSIADQPLVAGEAMALINGSPCATAFITEAALMSAAHVGLAMKLFCLSVEAFGAPLQHYDPALSHFWRDPYDQQAISTMQHLLHGATTEGRRAYQAPVSWRVIPRIMAVAYRAVATAKEVAESSLQSITDNPLFVFGDLASCTEQANYEQANREFAGADRVFSTGGYHNAQAGRALDLLTMAYADLITLCAKQTNKLLDGTISGLPPLLTTPEEAVVGTEFFAWMQSDFAARAQHQAQPTLMSMGLEDPQGGQSDIASTAFIAYERFLENSTNLTSALAILGVVACRALAHAKRVVAPPLQPLQRLIEEGGPHRPADYGAALAALQDKFMMYPQRGGLMGEHTCEE